jgi:hypothetical protein
MTAKYDVGNPRRWCGWWARARSCAAFRGRSWTPASRPKNPKFKKIHDNWVKFRAESISWFRVTENTFDDFMATAMTRRG